MPTKKPIGFWGLVVEPGKMYSQEVPVGFNITMAALGPDSYKSEARGRTLVMLTHQQDGEFALCSLVPEKHDQQPLDVVFTEGETIHLRVIGENAVHLTGYHLEEEPDNDMMGYDSEELDAELNGEDIASESEEDKDDEDDCCDDDEEVDSDMADFIDDDEISEGSDEDTEEEGLDSAEEDTGSDVEDAKIVRPSKRIREVISDEDDADDDDEEDEDYSEAEEDSDDGEDDDDEEEGDDDDEEFDSEEISGEEISEEEIDSDDAGSVDLSPQSRKLKESQKEVPAPKKAKIEAPAAAKKTTEAPAAAAAAKENAQPATPVSKTLPSGLKIDDVKAGAGIKAQKGRRVEITYSITNESGKALCSNEALAFNLGDVTIAKAIGIGIQGMALGGERKLTVPAAMVEKDVKPALPTKGNCTITVKLDKVHTKAGTN